MSDAKPIGGYMNDVATERATLRRALRELLEAIDYIEDMTFTRDIEPYKSEAIWNAAVENAEKALKDTQ